MAKKTFYFPHDGNARNDDRIIAVRMRHKMEGYGVYFAILERILESSNYMCAKDYNLIAFDLHVSAELVKSIVENFGLFKFTDDGEFFYSESFNDRMNPLENIREQRSLAGKKSAEKRAKNNGSSTTVQRPLKEKPTEESKVEYSKVKESKDSNYRDNSNELPLSGTEKPHAENIDYQKFIEWFNDKTKGVFGELRYPLSESRKGMMRARIKEHGKDVFFSVILSSAKSNFLKGDNKRNWRATFDWIIRPTNFEKILTGNFDNRTNGNSLDDDEFINKLLDK
ncbi:Lin1244/Lin1753 domain-containing protein [Dysgonomonas termitidis]|uniref:Lin1244/Lin1753 domain-containing protein n=1 Tax=Dysgonomonas termitidis TaxID=1516126 RepID=A0ABV9L352_9BACT